MPRCGAPTPPWSWRLSARACKLSSWRTRVCKRLLPRRRHGRQQRKRGLINCIGGSFHIDFVFQYVASHPQYGMGATASAKFPFAPAQLNTSLALQHKNGGSSSDGMANINVAGSYQATFHPPQTSAHP